ncbi:hypothetical protein MAPG_02575 [Magnaporthiopsis poae ATCC 64411]|uniref:Phosphatidylinositol-specific phospholipase C X domain-containing protein n=1 Tax=Magnaporthiopsis poae (strain ATCC 64411 / 73-15) TaxID=644358 RepID=A0A0C4DRR0_MAGP6|nr:hypothetical protein MAPG_02575 [Magnaporthiopsis poae ATCC 64411]
MFVSKASTAAAAACLVGLALVASGADAKAIISRGSPDSVQLDIFGSSAGPDGAFANWMAAYPDSTKIQHLNIPGTRDSATWLVRNGTTRSIAAPEDVVTSTPKFNISSCKMQDRSIADSLAAGVRFFDLRVNTDPDGKGRLVLYKGDLVLSEDTVSFEATLKALYGWLDAHSRELVLLSVALELGGNRDRSQAAQRASQQELYRVLTSDPATRYFYRGDPRDELPANLGAARGKIVLLRRFAPLDPLLGRGHDSELAGVGLPPDAWPVNSPGFAIVQNRDKNITTYVEDLHQPAALLPASGGFEGLGFSGGDSNGNNYGGDPLKALAVLPVKYNVTAEHLLKAASSAAPDSLFITFAGAMDEAGHPPIWPEVMALGNGSQYTPNGGVNNQLVPFIKSLAGKRLGIVVLDYYHQPNNLVQAILGK